MIKDPTLSSSVYNLQSPRTGIPASEIQKNIFGIYQNISYLRVLKQKYMLPSQLRELERQADVIEQNPEREEPWDVKRGRYVTATKNFADRYGYKDISNHITDVMVSIMMTRDKVLSGGSFVQAICNNNLRESISRADNDCINHLKLLSLTHSFCHVESNGL